MGCLIYARLRATSPLWLRALDPRTTRPHSSLFVCATCAEDARWAGLFFAPSVPKVADGTPAAYAVLIRLLVSKTDWCEFNMRNKEWERQCSCRCRVTVCLCALEAFLAISEPPVSRSVSRFILDRASRVLLKIIAARPDKSAPVAVPNANGVFLGACSILSA